MRGPETRGSRRHRIGARPGRVAVGFALRLTAVFRDALRAPMLAAWAFAAQANAAADVEAIAAGQRLDVAAVGRLYEEAIVHDGVDRAVQRLRAFADAPERQPPARASALLAVAHLHWRHGDLQAARAAADAAWAVRETVDAALLKARLLDAGGDPAGAVAWYERAAADTEREQEREFIALRLTMAQATERNLDALVAMAAERDASFGNRAAVTLALLGHPAQALALYRVTDAFGDPFRQRVRLAEWAIAAGAFDEAQKHGWQAFATAGPRADRRYALAVLMEAYREDAALDELLARLEADASADAELVRARVDLLVETERYDEAIAYYQATGDAGVDVEARRRLLNLYEAAGRTEDMVAEYRRQMAAAPQAVHWFAGLAGHYMNVAAPDEALAVWRAFAAANGDHPATLLEGAERMIEMGFAAQAVDMVERQMATVGEQAESLLFLFDARHREGRNEDALAVLQRLEAILPEDDSAIRDLADAYERLNKPEDAIRLLEALRAKQGELGYDERARLAWLYSAAGRKPEALAAWRALWVSVESAARRSLAEDQLLLLAAELNALADIVVELEEKLAGGAADKNEMHLLARVYTEVGDALSATEVIDEYARRDGDEVERLRQLGKVYMLLKDYSAYDTVLRSLVAADPQNEVEHVQNLVLNMLAYDLAEDSDERHAEIQRWLEKLRALDIEGVSGEFEGGLLSLGGYNEEAIASYRRALVQQPENSDNLLLLADTLKRAGRRDEAVTALQYAAEHAVDDNAFVVAVDGIVNMIGARSFTDRLTPAMRKTFRWAQRVILERITGRNDKFYLYQLLADIAQETGDSEGEFLALENALSQAGLRRPAILRELVTLATPNTGFGGFNTGGGDRQRQLAHGRRLIALRQALPPEVYINLGKVLLERGDLAGAEIAFDGIDDITGLIDVNRTKADLLREAGHGAEAMRYYTRALDVKPDDLALLSKTAMLRETSGREDVANRLYLRGVGNVLRTQPVVAKARRPGADQSPRALFGLDPDLAVNRDYRTYFEHLAQGLLITWPQDDATAAQRLAAVEAMFNDALKATGPAPYGQPLSGFPRLDHTARFARRVAEATGADELRQHVDAALAAFADTPKDAVAPPAENQTALDRHFALAKARGDFGAAARLARLAGDETRIADLLRERIAAGEYREPLAIAWTMLSPAAFRRVVSPFADTLKDNEAAFLELISGGAPLVLNIEERLGRDLIAPEELQRLAGGAAKTETRRSGAVLMLDDGPLSIWRYLKAKVGVDARIRYWASLVDAFKEGDYRASYTVRAVLEDILATELTPPQQQALIDAATDYAAKADFSDEFAAQDLLRLLLREVPTQNLEALYAVAERFGRRAKLSFDLGATLRAIFEAAPDEAFDALLELGRKGVWVPRFFSGPGTPDFTARFATQKAKLLERVRSGEQVDAATVDAIYRLELAPGFYRDEERLRRFTALAPRLLALNPEEPAYRQALIDARLSLGEREAAEQALLDYSRFAPEDELLRGALYFHWLTEGRFTAALALATDGGADYRDPAAVDALLEKAERRGPRGSTSELFRKFYAGPLRSAGFSPWDAATEREIERLRAVVAAADDQEAGAARSALRAVWRSAFAPADSDAGGRGPGADWRLRSLVNLPVEASAQEVFYEAPAADLASLLESDLGGEQPRLFDAIAGRPFAAAEFERFVAALPAAERERNPRLYALLGKAFDAAPQQRRRRLDALGERLRHGAWGDHEFVVWMALREGDEAPLTEEEAAWLRERAANARDPDTFEMLALARLFAKAGRSTPNALDAAVSHYQLLAAKLLRIASAPPSPGLSIEPPLDLAELIAEVAERLPSDRAWAVARGVLAISRPADEDADMTACFHAYALRTLSMLRGAEAALADAEEWAGSPPSDMLGCNGAYAVELARAHAGAGGPDQALAVLRALLRGAPSTIGDSGGDIEDFHRRRARQQFASLLGLGLGERSDVPLSPQEMLVLRRERIFPTRKQDVWDGSGRWTERAAEAMMGWLDEPQLVASGALDAVLLAAWQLRGADAEEAARAVFAQAAAKLDGVAAPPRASDLRLLALMALHLESALPLGLAEAALRRGIFTAAQEAAFLRYLAAHADAEATLRAGKAADRGGRLPVLRALLPLAEAAGDAAYAADLARRIGAAEAARAQLGLVATESGASGLAQASAVGN